MDRTVEAAVPPSDGLGTAAVELLGRLIRLDTSNPPGNEAEAQELLAAELGEAGFECELLAAEPGRPNLIARLRGEAPGPRLCLLGHVDTVPADAAEWSFDPWSGEVRGHEVRGRGAQDMKGQVAAEVAAAVALGTSGWRPARGELLVVITADEEMGAGAGARWLCETHPDKVACEWVVNEGAGNLLEIGDRRAYTLCIGEKGVFRFRLRARGRAGHASLPRIGENALLKLAPYLSRLASQPEHRPDGDAIRFLETLLGTPIAGPDEVTDALGRIGAADPAVAAMLVEPMLGVSLAPTLASASSKENVIPSTAEVLVDCRVPVGLGEQDTRAAIESAIGPGDYEIEFTERVVGNRSEPVGPLYDAIDDWLGARDPGALLAPMVMAGFSDSHWFRKELGAVAFGFCPQRSMPLSEAVPLIHGADERIRVSDVELAASLFADLPRRLLG